MQGSSTVPIVSAHLRSLYWSVVLPAISRRDVTCVNRLPREFLVAVLHSETGCTDLDAAAVVVVVVGDYGSADLSGVAFIGS